MTFCGKRRDQVRHLIAGPGVYICDSCIDLCNQVIASPPAIPPAASTGASRWVRYRRGRLLTWLRNPWGSRAIQQA